MSRKSSPPPLPTAPILLAPQSSRFLRENLEQALEYLDEHGFVVLKSVVNAEEIEKAKVRPLSLFEPVNLKKREKFARLCVLYVCIFFLISNLGNYSLETLWQFTS